MEKSLVSIWEQLTRMYTPGWDHRIEGEKLTGYSCVGVMKGGKVEIMVNDQGNRITPSYVAFTDEERLVGDAAKNQYASNPKRTIFDIK